MRLPRWLLIGLLITTAFAVVGLGGIWWVNWPDRTAREFLDLLAEKKYDEATTRFGWTPGWKNQTFALFSREPKVIESKFRSEPRTVLDMSVGRQTFKYGRSLVFRFTVIRGRIVESGYDSK
jgi:hypothetical protein